MRTLNELRDLLGLAPGDSLVEEERVPPPLTGIGHGLGSATAEAGLSMQTVDAILLQPSFTPDLDLGRRLGIKSVARWDGDSRLIALGDAPISSRFGAADLVPELGWLLDTRADGAAVVIQGNETRHPVYVHGDHGGLSIGRVEYAAAPEQTLTLRVPGRLALPDLAGLLQSLGVKSWLRDEIAGRASSESIVVRAAAVGLTARLAIGELDEPARVLSSIIKGEPDPLDVLRHWAKSLDTELVEFLETSALDEASALADQIDTIEQLVAESLSLAAELSLTFRRRRDDLESVAYVLRENEAGTSFLDALLALDRRAGTHLTAFDLVSDPDSEPQLFGAVSAAQPDAWWGTVWSD